MKKSLKIKFIAPDPHVIEVREKPRPASEFIPDWWKKMSPYADGNKFTLNPQPNTTAKKCFPLLDGITAGYIATLWADLLVTQTKEGPYVKWGTHVDVLEAWPRSQSFSYEIPEGFSETVFKYYHGWIIETPKDYSCLITHPIGYPNLPIKTITGIIDTDSLKTFANSPFVIKEGFEGIIEKGTPMFQIIPFKRDSWEAEYELMKTETNFHNNEKLHSRIVSSYGRFLRKPKEFK
jgi:hypothetical protein